MRWAIKSKVREFIKLPRGASPEELFRNDAPIDENAAQNLIAPKTPYMFVTSDRISGRGRFGGRFVFYQPTHFLNELASVGVKTSPRPRSVKLIFGEFPDLGLRV